MKSKKLSACIQDGIRALFEILRYTNLRGCPAVVFPTFGIFTKRDIGKARTSSKADAVRDVTHTHVYVRVCTFIRTENDGKRTSSSIGAFYAKNSK